MTSVSRRQALGGAASMGVGLPLLAACGAGGGASDGGAAAAGTKLVAAKDVPVGGGVIVSADKVIVTQPTKGEFKAFSTICTHAGCPISTIQGELIVCSCHGSEFSIADGSVQRGPATRPLPAVSIKQANGSIETA